MAKKNKFDISGTDLAKVLNFKRPYLYELVKKGVISKGDGVSFNLVTAVREIIEYKVNLAVRPLQEELEKFKNADPEKRLQTAKAEKAEIELLEYKKSLVDIKLANKLYLELAETFLQALDAFSSTEHSHKLLTVSNIKSVKKLNKELADLIRTKIADDPFELGGEIPQPVQLSKIKKGK